MPLDPALSINFLSPVPLSDKPLSNPPWLTRLSQLGIGSPLVQPIVSVKACYGVDGAYVFQQRFALTRQAYAVASFALVLMVSGSALLWLSRPVHALTQASQAALFARVAQPAPVLKQKPLLPGVVRAQVRPVPAVGPSTSTAHITPTVVVTSVAPVPSLAPTPAPAPTLQRVVYGFLPYWYVDKTEPLNFSLLSTLAYFGVEMNRDGTVNTSDPGWTIMQGPAAQDIFRQAREHKTRLVITFKSFNDGDIAALILDRQASKRAVATMVRVAQEQGAGGANIDFEYVGVPTDELRQEYSRFVRDVRDAFHAQIPGSEVTVSTYASAAKWRKLYDVQALAQAADALFIMAYDFYTVSSHQSGPVAPLHGFPNTYWYDVSTAVKDYAAQIPTNKMILGVPYYGYDWPVQHNEQRSEVALGVANTSSYKGSTQDPENTALSRGWDATGEVPYYTYKSEGGWRITYYDNKESLSKKYDLVNQAQLKGVGIWALGQQGHAPELWQLLAEKFQK